MAHPPIDVREQPRVSAAQLADYLAANTVLAQLGILRNAKYPGDARPIIIQYQHAKRAISSALISRESLSRIVADAVEDLGRRRDNPDSRPLIRDDARRSIDVIETFQRAVNALDLRNVRFEAARARPTPLHIAGVEVSVFPDAIVRATGRNEERIGQLFVRCAIGTEGDAAEGRRGEANVHLATLAHMHTAATLTDDGTPHSPTSLVIDVPRARVYRGPVSSTLRVRNIEAACGVIAALWRTL